MEQWNIQRSGGTCAGTGRELAPGEEYYAALVDEQDSFERKDFSLEYWQEHRPEVFSYWKTVVPVPSAKKKLFVDDGVLINLFERLADEKEPVRINFRFVLALILMRKRLLKYEDSQRQDSVEIWKMRFVRDTNIHDVINPHLEEDQIEQVSQELSGILQGEL